MKLLIGIVALFFTASVFAQTAPPKANKKPAEAKLGAQPKPMAPMGCKLVGTVRGTKIWAGDCTSAAAASETPLSPSRAAPPPSDVNTPAEKQ